jgi:hypothetical protein
MRYLVVFHTGDPETIVADAHKIENGCFIFYREWIQAGTTGLAPIGIEIPMQGVRLIEYENLREPDKDTP